MPAERARAFAPGRVNLIGEHTDYNAGLALPFAIAGGVTADAELVRSLPSGHIRAIAVDLDERDEFDAGEHSGVGDWKAFVRGVAGELQRAGWMLPATSLAIRGDLEPGAGLSSSAALELALCLSLLELALEPRPPYPRPIELARLCARVENDWVGAHTGLLDQLASLCGRAGQAVLIDFRSLETEHVPLPLGGWRLVVLDSGEPHEHASSGYNVRRAECARACELLGVPSLREAERADVQRLPEPLRSRAAHVLDENERVRRAAAALRAGEIRALGPLLDASHESLRELYEVSTPALDAAAQQLREHGAAGARMIGGGFGGSVLGLFPPERTPPAEALEVGPSAGARVLESVPAGA